MKKNHISIVLIVLFCTTINAQKNIYWRGGADGADDGNWFGDTGCDEIGQTQSNWYYPDFRNNEARDQPNCSDGTTDRHFLNFDNDHERTMTLDSDLSICRLLFQDTALDESRTIAGSGVITIANTNSNRPKIENNSNAVHTINTNIIVNFSNGEINPVNGSLTLGGNINNNSYNIQVYGNNAHTLTIKGVLSGSGDLTIEQNSTVVIDSDATMSGSTTLNDGKLILNASMSDSEVTVNNGATLQISQNVTLKSLTVNSGGTVTIASGKSLIINGTATGDVTYNQTLGTNWYLVSSPVSGETMTNMRANNSFANGTGDSRIGFAPYTTSNDTWSFFTSSSTDALPSGTGYSAKLSADGDISFSGEINTSDVTPTISSDGNGFNLLGNPYTAHVNSKTFLDANTNLDQTQLWVWKQPETEGGDGMYEVQTNASEFILAPAQGFFVKANSGTNVTFDVNNQLATGGTFQKTARTELKLLMTNGNSKRFAKINYVNQATKGFDAGYEGEVFGGIANSLDVYTNLVDDNQGKKYQIQSLPNSDLESMVIPVGIIADAGEITFSAETVNFPSELKVFLEDRQNNIFTRLDEANSSYAVTLTEKTDGVGRFYLHTNSSALSTDNVQLENISIYKANASTLRIVGLSQGKANVKLFNILGEQVLNRNFTSNGVYDVNLPQLATGVYIAQLENENGKINKKIVLE